MRRLPPPGHRLEGRDDLVRRDEASKEDSVFLTREDADTATVTFGDGVNGARLPTGDEKVRSAYRHGRGAAGTLDGPIGRTRVSNLAWLLAAGAALLVLLWIASRLVPRGLTAFKRVFRITPDPHAPETLLGAGLDSAQSVAGADDAKTMDAPGGAGNPEKDHQGVGSEDQR